MLIGYHAPGYLDIRRPGTSWLNPPESPRILALAGKVRVLRDVRRIPRWIAILEFDGHCCNFNRPSPGGACRQGIFEAAPATVLVADRIARIGRIFVADDQRFAGTEGHLLYPPVALRPLRSGWCRDPSTLNRFTIHCGLEELERPRTRIPAKGLREPDADGAGFSGIRQDKEALDPNGPAAMVDLDTNVFGDKRNAGVLVQEFNCASDTGNRTVIRRSQGGETKQSGEKRCCPQADTPLSGMIEFSA